MVSKEGHDKVLIVGGDSLIGRNLISPFKRQGFRIWQTTRRRQGVSDEALYLDLGKDRRLWSFPEVKVDFAILCAAITSTQKCEDDPDATRRINVTATVALARKLAAQGSFVIFLSTSAVFDGSRPFATADEPVNPKTEYGRQKAEAEKQLLRLGSSIAITRLGKVFYPGMPLFQSWITDLKAGKIIRPFSDLVCAPISLIAVVNFLLKVAKEKCGGISHLSGREDITYADVARWVAGMIGAHRTLVQPIESRNQARIVHVPNHTTLATDPRHFRLGPVGWDAVKTFFLK
jgi:dTDP-4-dehydrorhamnose reductase